MKCNFLLLIFISLQIAAVYAQSSKTSYSNNIEATFRDNQITIKEPRFRIGEDQISAQLAIQDSVNQTLSLKGQVNYKSANFVVYAQLAEFNLNTQQITFHEASFYSPENNSYANVKKIVRVSKEKLLLEDGFFTTCPPNERAWFITVNKIEYNIQNYAIVEDALFYAYDIPIFYIPVLPVNTTTKRKSGLLNLKFSNKKIQDDSGYGFSVSVPYFLNLGQDHDLTLGFELYTERGPAYSIEYNYAFSPGMRGKIFYWHIAEAFRKRQVSNEYLMREGDNPHPQRFNFTYDHRQKVGSNSYFFAEIEKNSDNQVLSDYFKQGIGSYISNKINLQIETAFDWGFVSLFTNKDDYFRYRSRFRIDKNPNNLNERFGAEFFLSMQPIINFPVYLQVNNTIVDFERKEGWNGLKNNFQAALDFNYDYNGQSIKATVNYDINSYQNLVFNTNNEQIKTDSFAYHYLTKTLYYGFNLVRYLKGDQREEYKLTLIPYTLFIERDDVDSRKSLNLRPTDSLAYDSSDYQQYHDKFSLMPKLTARRSLTFGINFSVKQKINKKISPFLEGKIFSNYNFYRKPNIANNINYFKGPIIEEIYQETSIGDYFGPLRIDFKIYPQPNIIINSFMRYESNKNLIADKNIQLTLLTSNQTTTRLQYKQNTKSYKNLDGQIFPEIETIGLYRRQPLSERWVLSVEGNWNLTRRKILPNDNTVMVDDMLTEGIVNLRFIHCCYSLDITYKQSLNNKTTSNKQIEYIERTFYLTFNILNNSIVSKLKR